MARSLKLHSTALGLAFLILTVAPVASHPPFVTVADRDGGASVIHKNGPTPVWMAGTSNPADVNA